MWLRQDCLQDFHPRRNWDETSSKILYKTGTSSRFPVTLVPCEKQIRKNDQSACTLSQFLSGDKFLVFLFILIQSTNCDGLWSAHANMIKCILLIKEILIFGTLVLFSFLQSEPLSHILQIISSQCTFFCSKLGINGCKVLIVEDYPILLTEHCKTQSQYQLLPFLWPEFQPVNSQWKCSFGYLSQPIPTKDLFPPSMKKYNQVCNALLFWGELCFNPIPFLS